MQQVGEKRPGGNGEDLVDRKRLRHSGLQVLSGLVFGALEGYVGIVVAEGWPSWVHVLPSLGFRKIIVCCSSERGWQ